jgi:hypothetical protein
MKANRVRRRVFFGVIGVLGYWALLSPQTGIQEGVKPVDAYGVQSGARSLLVLWLIGWGIWLGVRLLARSRASERAERLVDRAQRSKDGLLDGKEVIE